MLQSCIAILNDFRIFSMALRSWGLGLTFVKHTRQSPAGKRYLTDIVVNRRRK